MIKKNSKLYKFLESFYNFKKNHINPGVNEVRFELIDSDVLRIDVKDNRFSLYLTVSGLDRIKKKIYYYGAIPLVLLYVNEHQELLKLTKCENLRDVLYNDVLIWHALNAEDIKLQKSVLAKFIS